jgi:hypothetical protein
MKVLSTSVELIWSFTIADVIILNPYNGIKYRVINVLVSARTLLLLFIHLLLFLVFPVLPMQLLVFLAD